MEEVILKKGKYKGNVSVIIAGIHGNETCGVFAFNEIIDDLNIENGTVYFIYGNPKAIKINKRMFEFNLNRAFLEENEYDDDIKNTYEFKRAQFIKKYLDKSSALLDLHSGEVDVHPFMFAEKNSIEIIKYFPKEFSYVVSGIEDIEPGGADGYMNKNGKIGICIECGKHNNPDGVSLSKRSIYGFLFSRNHIYNKNNCELYVGNRNHLTLSYSYYTKTDRFILCGNFPDFSFVAKGSCVGHDDGDEVLAPFDGFILFARNRYKKNTEGFLFGFK